MALKGENMDNRAIIVVWKWNLEGEKFCDFIGTGNSSEFEIEVEASDDKKFIGFTKANQIFNKGEPYTPEYSEQNIEDKCNFLLTKDYKILLLLHKGDPDNFIESNAMVENLNDKNIIIDFFSGGNGSIYENIINSKKTCFREDAINNPEVLSTIEIKKEKFDKVWEYYKKKVLQKKKTEFIKLWLPIAIDMQGLYEVKEKQKNINKYEEYLGEIKNSYKDHFKKINNFHKENEEYFKGIFDIKEVKGNIIDDKGILKYYPGFSKIFEDTLKKFDEKITENK